MALDFTIVTDVRQRFGDNQRDEKESLSERESGIEADAPFAGSEKIFAFRCPSVDGTQFALLLFQTLGVSVRQNLEINGQTIFGGIAPSVDFDSRTLGSGSEAHRVSVVFKTGGRGGVLDPRAATATARTRKARPAKRAKKAAKKRR